jgi:calcineurin-like phosphoesterase family protein
MAFTRKFYTSDHHFGHQSVIQHCNRPFADADEMDAAMIANWNRVVGPQDIVYCLGDFSLYGVERTKEIFDQLRGRKFLVLGNHDLDSKGKVHKRIRDLDWAAPPSHAIETTDQGVRVYMHHYACRVWPSSHYGAVHFYGHSHGRLPGIGKSRDVGVDMPDVAFTPRTFSELTANMPKES